jgi:SAM-dependent methyltransferase
MNNHKEGGIMSALSFAGDMARLQRAIAEAHDLVVRRGIVLETLNLRTGERVLELGCGGGYYTHEAARFVGPTGRVCAIDISPDQIAAAQARCAEFAWVECRERILQRHPKRQTPIAILNTSYNPASFSYWVAQVIRPFVVNRQSVTEEEAAEWFDELAKLEETGAYFFCITPVLTEAVKVI